MRVLTVGLLLAQLALLATPLPAQTMLKPEPSDKTQPRTKFVTTYGTDPCPKSTDPDEIVVCVNRPDEERFRIPPSVRTDTGRPTGPNERKALLGDDAGGAGGGIGSCTAVGPGGGTGCFQAQSDAYRAAKKAGDVPKLP